MVPLFNSVTRHKILCLLKDFFFLILGAFILVYMWNSGVRGDNLRKMFSLSTLWVLGIELRSLGKKHL